MSRPAAERGPTAVVDPRFSDWRDRARLDSQIERVLHRGGSRNPDVFLVRSGSEYVVVKDFAPRAAWVRASLGRLLTCREQRAYAKLAGHPAVPRLLGAIDAMSLVLEHRPGRMLTRSLATSLPAGFLAELEASVAAMHARGVVHLDLRHRSNILLGEDGRPVLLDFASAICLEPGGLLARLLLPLLTRIDRSALAKWRDRLAS